MGENGNRGPVDVVVLNFPGNRFTGDIIPALRDLVVADVIRVIDLLLVYKDTDGSVGTVTLEGLGPDLQPSFLSITGRSAGGLLDSEDAEEVAPGLEPGNSAAILAVENRWLIPFIRAVRDAGGEVVDQARVPADVIEAQEAKQAVGSGGA
ncbi:DUF1269 domain-containing protein [Microlunatus elymi]|uniref:DUF1269 domain-containing protein n=1 Tax=Microlunatus elymi TaxID=2596828 RepID=A0A516Q4E3_9ACTN|nr:DUF6325 family protein [Microlunatus elymi]QDP98242.1 DUF1269 domain-containing protein [Microlunatus elymi]